MVDIHEMAERIRAEERAAATTFKMKALSIRQPWATAIALGSKRIETRSMKTAYRGPLLIHASTYINVSMLLHQHAHWNWQGAMAEAGWSWKNTLDEPQDLLPFGALIALVDLVDCIPVASLTVEQLRAPRQSGKGEAYNWTEEQLGDFRLGRYGWMLARPRLLKRSIKFRGMPGIFNVAGLPEPDASIVRAALINGQDRD